MRDAVYQSFLETQLREALQFSQRSDLFQLNPLSPTAFLALLHGRALRRTGSGEIHQTDQPVVAGIQLPDDYLRRVDPVNVVCLLTTDIWHPNVHGPLICLGRMPVGTSLMDICVQIHEIVTFQRWTPHDPLNEAAAQWSRQHADRFPIDPRPLGWSAADRAGKAESLVIQPLEQHE